jgi:hypothetical protein
MHPAIQYDVARARIADLHRQAQRDALARAASRARHARAHQRSHPARGSWAAIARRALAPLAAARGRRTAAQAQSQH